LQQRHHKLSARQQQQQPPSQLQQQQQQQQQGLLSSPWNVFFFFYLLTIIYSKLQMDYDHHLTPPNATHQLSAPIITTTTTMAKSILTGDGCPYQVYIYI
jgi:hypothetical protein